MTVLYGPTFGDEVIAAGLGGLPFAWSETEIYGRENLTAEQNADLDAVIAAHDPTKTVYVPPVNMKPLDIKTTAEILGATGA